MVQTFENRIFTFMHARCIYMAHTTIYMRAVHLASNNNNVLQRFSQHWRRVIQPLFFKYIYDFFLIICKNIIL